MSMKSVAGLLPEFVRKLDEKVDGGIPEPHRTEIFGIVGLDPSKKVDSKVDKR